MKLKIAAITNHPEHMAIYKLCFAGVGFYKGGSYEFYSHEGDYIGTAPAYRDWETNTRDRKSTRLNSSHITRSRMPSSA